LPYKISGKGLEKPSYIVGTYHLAPASFADQIHRLKNAFEECEQVYGEIALRETSKPKKQTELQQKQILHNGVTLSSLLSDEQLNKLNELLREVMGKVLNNEAMAAQMNRLSPALISNSIMLITYAKSNPDLLRKDQSKLLDDHYLFIAVEKGKAVKEFETANFQMEIIFGKSLKQQVEDLMCMVENYRETVGMAEFVTEVYFSQDLEHLQDLCEDEAMSSCGSSPEDSDNLIYNKNASWVEAMPEIMADKPIFSPYEPCISAAKGGGYHY